MRDTFVKTLINEAKKNPNIELITGDLGFGVLQPYIDALPNQFTDAGIAEQAMTSIAAGMAREGKIVVNYSIGNFPTLRCLEQIRNDCCYHDANVKVVAIGGGFTYGSLGMSHHATDDISVMRGLPNLTILAPGDAYESEACTKYMLNHDGTFYLRLDRGGGLPIHNHEFDIDKIIRGLKIREYIKDAVILATGGILSVANEVSKNLEITLYSFPMVKPMCKETIEELAKKYSHIITLEENNVLGGFGSAVCEIIAEMKGPKAIVHKIGIEDCYSTIVGSQTYLRDVYGLSPSKVEAKIKDLLK